MQHCAPAPKPKTNPIHRALQMYNMNGLQKLCDILIEHPSWSLAHVIAHFNLTDYIANPSIIDFLDYAEYAEMMTPLHVRILISESEELHPPNALAEFHLQSSRFRLRLKRTISSL